uniref:Uncharacterized protein n=1 Tax=Ciona intestinalis TaxID=7719 RepID=H2XPI3_CIOIN
MSVTVFLQCHSRFYPAVRCLNKLAEPKYIAFTTLINEVSYV